VVLWPVLLWGAKGLSSSAGLPNLILMVGANARPVVTTRVANMQPVVVVVCLRISTAGASTTSPLPTWLYSASSV
jgi:hypothetical protein